MLCRVLLEDTPRCETSNGEFLKIVTRSGVTVEVRSVFLPGCAVTFPLEAHKIKKRTNYITILPFRTVSC
jgi:hypothetical protein